MLFELEPDNRGAPDEVLIADLQSVAAKLGKNAVARDEYEAHGRFHPQTLVKRFGSWNTSLETAGLRVLKPHLVSSDEFLNDVRRVAALLNSESLTVDQYLEYGAYSLSPLPRLFGKWQGALERAGLKPSNDYVAPMSRAELLENLASVWRALGRQPKQSDMRKPLSLRGHDAYTRRFGSWRAALEFFVSNVNIAPPAAEETAETTAALPSPLSQSTDRTNASRTAGWRLRFLVMRRDRFCCCQCGASPAASPGTVLAVDHVVPWSQGGFTTLENLQTLCVPCNGGKSDLSANAA